MRDGEVSTGRAIHDGAMIGAGIFHKKTDVAEITINLVDNNSKDAKPTTMYVEKGLGFSFGDGQFYTVDFDGKVYDKNGNQISTVDMTSAQYGILGGISKTKNEKLPQNAQKNDPYVLTSQDIDEAYKLKQDPDKYNFTQKKINNELANAFGLKESVHWNKQDYKPSQNEFSAITRNSANGGSKTQVSVFKYYNKD